MTRPILQLGLLPLLVCSAPAQSSKSAPPLVSRPAPAVAGTPVIRTEANLVLVDVVVTEKGKPVQGLDARQFHLFENGKQQRIAVFEEHRSDDAPQLARVPALPPGVYSNYPRFAVASAANVLLLDALNTPLSDQSYVRRQMVEYLRHIPPGTRIAVFTLASRLRMVEGFTTDASALESAITHGKGNPQVSVLLPSPQDQDEMNGIAQDMSDVDQGAMQQFLADSQSFQTDLRVRMTLDAMQELGRYLATIPGRKNLIWFSASFPLAIDVDPDSVASQSSNPASAIDPFSAMRDYSEEVRAADTALTAARVAVYPVDARGLMNLAGLDASRNFYGSGVGSPFGNAHTAAGMMQGQTPSQKASVQALQQNVREHQTMQQIAEETGGEAFFDTNGLKQAVARAIENGSNYYTLAYMPDIRVWDGSWRRIEVRVDGGHYDLAYRRGYYTNDPLKPGGDAVSSIVAALQRGAPPLSQIILEARVLSAADPAAKAVKVSAGPAGELADTLKPPVQRFLVDFAIDPRGLTWAAADGGHRQAVVEASMVAWTADGDRVNFTDRAFAVSLDGAELARAAASGLPLHQEIDLPSGDLYLRVAIHDLASGRIGSLEIPVHVPRN